MSFESLILIQLVFCITVCYNITNKALVTHKCETYLRTYLKL